MRRKPVGTTAALTIEAGQMRDDHGSEEGSAEPGVTTPGPAQGSLESQGTYHSFHQGRVARFTA